MRTWRFKHGLTLPISLIFSEAIYQTHDRIAPSTNEKESFFNGIKLKVSSKVNFSTVCDNKNFFKEDRKLPEFFLIESLKSGIYLKKSQNIEENDHFPRWAWHALLSTDLKLQFNAIDSLLICLSRSEHSFYETIAHCPTLEHLNVLFNYLEQEDYFQNDQKYMIDTIEEHFKSLTYLTLINNSKYWDSTINPINITATLNKDPSYESINYTLIPTRKTIVTNGNHFISNLLKDLFNTNNSLELTSKSFLLLKTWSKGTFYNTRFKEVKQAFALQILFDLLKNISPSYQPLLFSSLAEEGLNSYLPLGQELPNSFCNRFALLQLIQLFFVSDSLSQFRKSSFNKDICNKLIETLTSLASHHPCESFQSIAVILKYLVESSPQSPKTHQSNFSLEKNFQPIDSVSASTLINCLRKYSFKKESSDVAGKEAFLPFTNTLNYLFSSNNSNTEFLEKIICTNSFRLYSNILRCSNLFNHNVQSFPFDLFDSSFTPSSDHSHENTDDNIEKKFSLYTSICQVLHFLSLLSTRNKINSLPLKISGDLSSLSDWMKFLVLCGKASSNYLTESAELLNLWSKSAFANLLVSTDISSRIYEDYLNFLFQHLLDETNTSIQLFPGTIPILSEWFDTSLNKFLPSNILTSLGRSNNSEIDITPINKRLFHLDNLVNTLIDPIAISKSANSIKVGSLLARFNNIYPTYWLNQFPAYQNSNLGKDTLRIFNESKNRVKKVILNNNSDIERCHIILSDINSISDNPNFNSQMLNEAHADIFLPIYATKLFKLLSLDVRCLKFSPRFNISSGLLRHLSLSSNDNWKKPFQSEAPFPFVESHPPEKLLHDSISEPLFNFVPLDPHQVDPDAHLEPPSTLLPHSNFHSNNIQLTQQHQNSEANLQNKSSIEYSQDTFNDIKSKEFLQLCQERTLLWKALATSVALMANSAALSNYDQVKSYQSYWLGPLNHMLEQFYQVVYMTTPESVRVYGFPKLREKVLIPPSFVYFELLRALHNLSLGEDSSKTNSKFRYGIYPLATPLCFYIDPLIKLINPSKSLSQKFKEKISQPDIEDKMLDFFNQFSFNSIKFSPISPLYLKSTLLAMLASSSTFIYNPKLKPFPFTFHNKPSKTPNSYQDIINMTLPDHDFDIILIHGMRGSAFRTWRLGSPLNTLLEQTENQELINFDIPSEAPHIPNAQKINSQYTIEKLNEADFEIMRKEPGNLNNWFFLWPRDILFREFPKARIIGLNFEAPIFPKRSKFVTDKSNTDPASNSLIINKQRIKNTSEMSLEEITNYLNERLEDSGVGQKPIVFIGHSMGGLIIEMLLIHSPKLASKTEACIFFAVPHHGSPIASETSFLGPITASYTKSMDPKEQFLTKLHERFSQFLNDYPGIKIVSMAESLKTPMPSIFGDRLVVPPNQAMPSYPCIFHIIDGCNHFEICKPSSIFDIRYKDLQKILLKVRSNSY